MKKPCTREEAEALYAADFYQWTLRTAEDLKDGRLSQADLDHVAEEIVGLGKRDRREVRSRAIVLILQLLKWSLQPELRDGSTWLDTIDEQRDQLDLLFEDSPSLTGVLQHELPLLYMRAADKALRETGKSFNLPAKCPFTTSQIMSRGWLPE